LRASQKYDSQVTERTSFKHGVGLLGKAFASGKSEWIVDVTKDINFLRSQSAADNGIKAGFAAPKLVGEDVVAVMEFFSEETFEPDQDLLSVLENISTQYGRVIERKKAESMITSAHNLITESIIPTAISCVLHIIRQVVRPWPDWVHSKDCGKGSVFTDYPLLFNVYECWTIEPEH